MSSILPIQNITIITVCYNSLAVLPKMLASIPIGVPVILIDNASTDSARLNALAGQYNAVVHINDVNKGFGVACNQGAALAETDFLLFLNPDAQLREGSLMALIDSAAKHPKASAFNPRILNEGGKQSFRRHSKLKPQNRVGGPLPWADTQITVLSGCAIFLHRNAFDTVGGFDPSIFLYHEDDDLALRLHGIGPLIYCHAAVVTHLEGQGSVSSHKLTEFKAYHWARSRIFTYTKHGKINVFYRTFAISCLRLLNPSMLFSARKRAKNIGFFKGVNSAFKDGGCGEGLASNQIETEPRSHK